MILIKVSSMIFPFLLCRYLTEEKFKQPVIVYNYPKKTKAFYSLNEDGETVFAMDVVVPKVRHFPLKGFSFYFNAFYSVHVDWHRASFQHVKMFVFFMFSGWIVDRWKPKGRALRCSKGKV